MLGTFDSAGRYRAAVGGSDKGRVEDEEEDDEEVIGLTAAAAEFLNPPTGTRFPLPIMNAWSV
jgi:hypothetical protein